MATETFSRERKWLEESKAKRLSFTEGPLLDFKELHRFWSEPDDTDTPKCLQFLGLYGSAKNYPNQRQWVENPMAGGKPYPGVWRIAQNREVTRGEAAEVPGQILRFGFIGWTTHAQIDWTEARILNGDFLQEDEGYLDVVIPNVDPAVAGALAESIQTAASTTSLTLQGQSFAGTWEYVHVRPEETEDGSQRIRIFMAQPQYTLTQYENYGEPDQVKITRTWNVPKRLAQSLSNTNNQVTGADGSASYQTDQGTVDMIFRTDDATSVSIVSFKAQDNCVIRVYHDYYWGITQDTAEAFDVEVAPTGWFYHVPIITNAGRGRYNLRRIREEAKASTSSERSVNEDINQVTKETQYLNQASPPSLVSFTTGVLNFISFVKNRFCLFDSRKRKVTSKPWSENFVLKAENGEDETHYIAGNQLLLTSIPSPGSANVLRRISGPNRNSDGTWNWYFIKMKKDEGLGDGGTASYQTGKVLHRTRIITQTQVVIEQKKELTFTVNVKQFPTLAEALTWTAAGAWIRSQPWTRLGHRMYLGFQTSGQSGSWVEEI